MWYDFQEVQPTLKLRCIPDPCRCDSADRSLEPPSIQMLKRCDCDPGGPGPNQDTRGAGTGRQDTILLRTTAPQAGSERHNRNSQHGHSSPLFPSPNVAPKNSALPLSISCLNPSSNHFIPHSPSSSLPSPHRQKLHTATSLPTVTKKQNLYKTELQAILLNSITSQ